MGTDWVVDASVAVKLLALEEDSEVLREFFSQLPAGSRLLAPSLLRYEVGHALSKHATVPNLEYLLAHGLATVERTDPVDVATSQGNLSYYDAAYLALAIEQKAGLLSADERLRKAARRHGLPLGP